MSISSRWYLWALGGLCLMVLGLYVSKPGFFERLMLENGPVETTSAILLLASSWIFGQAALKERQQDRGLAVLMIIGSLGLFVMGMEEISWFQHYLRFQTPDFMRGNLQGETNLHNFHTDVVELIFINGAFFLMAVLPFIRWKRGVDRWPRAFRVPIAGDVVFFTTLLAVGFADDMVSSALSKFRCALAVLFLIARARQGGSRILGLCLFWVALIGLSIGAFTVRPTPLERPWLMTEFGEFLYSLAFFLNALQAASARRLSG